jgi:hypothetical protein
MNIFRQLRLYGVNTRHKHYLHKPAANLACFQISIYSAGIKIFNNLPSDVRNLMNENA